METMWVEQMARKRASPKGMGLAAMRVDLLVAGWDTPSAVGLVCQWAVE